MAGIRSNLNSRVEIVHKPRPSRTEGFALHYMGYVMRQSDAPITELHYHDNLEIGYCYEGAGVFVIGEKLYSYGAGDVVVIAGGEFHCAKSDSESAIEGTYCWTDPVQLLGGLVEESRLLDIGLLSGPEFVNILPGRQFPELAEAARSLFDELLNERGHFRDACRAHVLSILCLLHRDPRTGAGRSARPQTTRARRFAPALRYMADHYDRRIRMSDLAEQCHMSESNFRRAFRRAMGVTAAHYLTRLRIRMAASLLTATDTPIVQIGPAVGYESMSSFNQNFRNVMGVSPGAYRQSSATRNVPAQTKGRST